MDVVVCVKPEQNDRISFIIDASLLFIVILTSFYLILTNKNPNPSIIALKSVFVDVSGEIQSQINNVDDYLELKSQNDSLRMELERMYHANSAYKHAYFELIDLKKNLNFRIDKSLEFIFAEVIARNVSSLSKQITINRGTIDSVRLNDPVLFKNNVVGKVVFVNPHFSRVQLATDPLFEMSVRVLRTGRIGTLSPRSDGFFKLNYITKNADVRPGDVIVSSGLSPSYPKHLRLGVVQSTNTEIPGLFYEIKVKSDVVFDQLRYVSLIKRPVYSAVDSVFIETTEALK